MLYVSRYIDSGYFGVVDSASGVEQRYSYKHLKDLVFSSVEVRGVTPIYGSFEAIRVEPYQPVETLTQLQLKTSLLHFVDVKTYGDIITSVVWHGNKIASPVSVRLSDFGSIVADQFILNNSDLCESLVTLVLDDKLQYSFFSFKSPKGLGTVSAKLHRLGVTLDMRELNDKNAKSAYYLLSDYVLFSKMHNCVIDIPKRLHKVEKEGNKYLCNPERPSFV